MSKNSNNPNNESRDIEIRLVMVLDDDHFLDAASFQLTGSPCRLPDFLDCFGYDVLELECPECPEHDDSTFVVYVDEFENILPVWMLFKHDCDEWDVSDMRVSGAVQCEHE